jgi:hypothetical protein
LCSQFEHGIHAYDRQSCAAQRCSVVGPAVLRGTGVNFVGACWLWASPLFSLGIAPDRVYCLRAEDRAYPRGNRRGTRQASGRSYPDARRLGAPLGRMDETDRPKDRRTPAYQGWPDAMYWMRMPFHRQMQTGESRRSSWTQRARSAVLAWLIRD